MLKGDSRTSSQGIDLSFRLCQVANALHTLTKWDPNYIEWFRTTQPH